MAQEGEDVVYVVCPLCASPDVQIRVLIETSALEVKCTDCGFQRMQIAVAEGQAVT
jgi:translation initiation factor 2 beta subunit (eIF-2beta)/eIF-5